MMLNDNSTIAALLGQTDLTNHPLLQSLNLAQPHSSLNANCASHLQRHLLSANPVLGIAPGFHPMAPFYTRHPQHSAPSLLVPSLPPKLREHERMEFVRQWVNNIPDYASSQGSTGAPRSPTTSSLYSLAGCYGNNGSQDPQSLHISSTGAPHQPHDILRRQSSSSLQSRLFTDSEMSFIVQQFRKYFENGELPPLAYVRSILNESTELNNRKPISIRGKIKRLQINGKWRDFI